MLRFGTTIALTAALSGCAIVRSSVHPYRTLPPKPTPEAVEVFTERSPDRPFTEVGLIEVSGNTWAGYARLIQRAQQEAARIGADAIVISHQPVESVHAFLAEAPGGGLSAAAFQSEQPRIWVVAVAWKESP